MGIAVVLFTHKLSLLALVVAALVIFTLVVLLKIRKRNRAAAQSAACCLWMAVATIFAWDSHKRLLWILIDGAFSLIFGIVAVKEVDFKRQRNE